MYLFYERFLKISASINSCFSNLADVISEALEYIFYCLYFFVGVHVMVQGHGYYNCGPFFPRNFNGYHADHATVRQKSFSFPYRFYSPGLPRLQAQGPCVSWTISFCDFYFALCAGFDRACSFALSFRLFFRLRRLRSSSFLRSIFLCPPMMPPCLYWDEATITVRIGEERLCVKY